MICFKSEDECISIERKKTVLILNAFSYDRPLALYIWNIDDPADCFCYTLVTFLQNIYNDFKSIYSISFREINSGPVFKQLCLDQYIKFKIIKHVSENELTLLIHSLLRQKNIYEFIFTKKIKEYL